MFTTIFDDNFKLYERRLNGQEIMFNVLRNLFEDQNYSKPIHEVLIPFYKVHPEIFLMDDSVGHMLLNFIHPSQEIFFIPDDLLMYGSETNQISNFVRAFKGSDRNLVRLHLCGDGEAGKTTLLKCLLDQFYSKETSLLTANILNNDTKRTVGVTISPHATLGGRYFSIFDYGGQKEFHTTHDRFFEGPPSIFVIVVSLVEEILIERKSQNPKRFKRKELDDIRNEILYWNRFVNTCCEPG